MIKHPRFRSCFHVEVIPSFGVLLLTERDYRILHDRACDLIAPLLDGRHTPREIVERLQGRFSSYRIYDTLRQLEKKGYLVDGGGQEPTPEDAFWDIMTVEAGPAALPVQPPRLSVAAFGAVPREAFIDVLTAAGLAVVPEDGTWEVVLTDSYLHEALAGYNRHAVAQKKPYLLVKPTGARLWIGPLVRPGRTACWQCLAARLNANLPAPFLFDTPRPEAPTAYLSSTVQAALHIAATEVAKWVRRGVNKRLEDRLVTFDTVTLTLEDHVVMRRPYCLACGTAPPTEPRPLRLQHRQKTIPTMAATAAWRQERPSNDTRT